MSKRKDSKSREEYYYTSNEDMRHLDSSNEDDTPQQLPPLEAQETVVSEMQVGSRKTSVKSQGPKSYVSPMKNSGPSSNSTDRRKSHEPNGQAGNYASVQPRYEMDVRTGSPRFNGYHTGGARPPDPATNCEYVDPNCLSPTYSMVSYCPIIGKCGIFPLYVFDQMRAAMEGTATPGCCTGPPVVMPMPQCLPAEKLQQRYFQESKYCQTDAMHAYPNYNCCAQYPGMHTLQQTGHGTAQTQANEFDMILPPPGQGQTKKDVVVYSRESQSHTDLPTAKMAVTEIPYASEQTHAHYNPPQPPAEYWGAQQLQSQQYYAPAPQHMAQHCCAQHHAQYYCAQQHQVQHYCCVQQTPTTTQKQNTMVSQDGENGVQLPEPKIAVTEMPYPPQPEPQTGDGFPTPMAQAEVEHSSKTPTPTAEKTPADLAAPVVEKSASIVTPPSVVSPEVAKPPSALAAAPASKRSSVTAAPPGRKPSSVAASPATAKRSSVAAPPPGKKLSSVAASTATAKRSSVTAPPPGQKPSSVAASPATAKRSSVATSPATAKRSSVASSVAAAPPTEQPSSVAAAPPPDKPSSVVAAPPVKSSSVVAPAGQSPPIQTEILKAPKKSTSGTLKTIKTGENLDSNRVRGADKEDDDSLFALRKIENKNVDLHVLKAESKVAFQDQRTIVGGISGLRLYAESKQVLSDEEKDFIDYFVEYEGVKYIRILEEMYGTYKDRVQGVLKLGTEPESRRKFDQAHIRIAEFWKIIEVDLEKQLQEYDFPNVLENDVDKFRIDTGTKIAGVGKLHNYGVKMILYWLRLLETKSKPLDPKKIYQVATELMAEIMVLCYSLFVRIAEFLTRLADDATREEVNTFTLEYLTNAFRNLVDCICDEMGAIGESCGQVMIRIPSLSREEVVKTMTKLYTQINYADISISRAIESMTPIIHMYYIRYFIEKKQPTRATR